MSANTKSQTNLEEWFNTVSHGITAAVAVGGLVVLIVFGAQSNKNWSLFSALVYGSSLVLLYTFSALYHGLGIKKQNICLTSLTIVGFICSLLEPIRP